ncbi:MAG TPA: CRISPR-associated endonuclease Cas6 [Chitinophagaceae bacterium]|nr:CRISPR-associated endonuclease Cas6 [Chitinophagaceae bacterium]
MQDSTLLIRKAIEKGKTKTVYPLINSVLVEFSLKIGPHQIHDFREAVLKCIPNAAEREIFSNEKWVGGAKKTIVRYPKIQYRERNGHAAIWAVQEGAALLIKFIQEYKHRFEWGEKKFSLNLLQLPEEIKNFTVKPVRRKAGEPLQVYHLYYYIPFINENPERNYDWYKASRNLPDTEKTKRLQELLTAHLCSFIHYTGGFIPKEKIKLTIVDKKLLEGVTFKGRIHAAYEIRYTVNLPLPPFIALGNKCSHGFGWQLMEQG